MFRFKHWFAFFNKQGYNLQLPPIVAITKSSRGCENRPKDMGWLQGLNEVRWRPGQETSSAPPCSSLKSFGTKCAVVESTCDIVGTFRRTRSDSAPPAVVWCPGNSPHPLVTPMAGLQCLQTDELGEILYSSIQFL